jgi:hypothetical protein
MAEPSNNGAPNDTGKQGHHETNKVSGEGPSNTSSASATSGALEEGTLGEGSISVQGGDALTGSGEGSYTRAGSPEGGAAQGSEGGEAETQPSMAGSVSPADAGMPGGASPQGQGASPGAAETLHADASLQPRQGERPADEARSFDAGNEPKNASEEIVNNVGTSNLGPHGDPVEGKRDAAATGDDADAATG